MHYCPYTNACDHMKARKAPDDTTYCVHCTRIQVFIYGATFQVMSKMITLPEPYPKHTLSPEIDDEMKF